MKIHTLEFETKSNLLPPFAIPMGIKEFNPITTIMLAKIIRDTEERILGIECPVNLIESRWITARLGYYNFLDFDYPQIHALEKFISESYVEFLTGIQTPVEKIYCHAWVNIVRKGEQITKHNHADAHTNLPGCYSYLSGNLTIEADNTSTNYESPYNGQLHRIPNQNGSMTLFPSFVMHHTSINKSEFPRLSIAFDIIPETTYNLMTDNKHLFKELS